MAGDQAICGVGMRSESVGLFMMGLFEPRDNHRGTLANIKPFDLHLVLYTTSGSDTA